MWKEDIMVLSNFECNFECNLRDVIVNENYNKYKSWQILHSNMSPKSIACLIKNQICFSGESNFPLDTFKKVLNNLSVLYLVQTDAMIGPVELVYYNRQYNKVCMQCEQLYAITIKNNQSLDSMLMEVDLSVIHELYYNAAASYDLNYSGVSKLKSTIKFLAKKVGRNFGIQSEVWALMSHEIAKGFGDSVQKTLAMKQYEDLDGIKIYSHDCLGSINGVLIGMNDLNFKTYCFNPFLLVGPSRDGEYHDSKFVAQDESEIFSMRYGSKSLYSGNQGYARINFK